MARWVSPSRARLHVADLRAYGIGYRTIATLAGMEMGQLQEILKRAGRIRWETERRILRVRFDLDELPDEAQLLIVGTRRRLQALIVIGWTQKEIAERAGMTTVNLGKLLTWHAQRYITARVARRIRDVYDDLCLTPGGNLRARLRGERRNWAPPMAWDDDTIDHPDTQPLDVTREAAPKIPSEETAEEVEWFLRYVDAEATEQQIAARLGLGQGSVYQALKRAERQDLADRLKTNATLRNPTTKEHAA